MSYRRSSVWASAENVAGDGNQYLREPDLYRALERSLCFQYDCLKPEPGPLIGALPSGILAMERPPCSLVSAASAYMESAPISNPTEMYTLSIVHFL
jgi:hypothetical protein